MATWLIDKAEQLTLDGDVTQLDVWLAHGKLRVVGTEGPARIDVRKVGRRGLTVTQENGVLSVRHPVRQGWWHLMWFGGGRRNYDADVTIAVPPGAYAGLTLMSGNLVASGLRNGAKADVVSGQITLMGLGGTVRAKTVSGAIQAMGIAGDLGLETVSGEITLAESSAERVWARTISGSVTCDLDNPLASDVRIDTTSGSITVRVPTDADLDVNVAATSGRVTSAFPQIRPSNLPGHKSAQGRIGSGSGMLRAYAVSGSVALLAAPSHEDER
jgi:DUF4097 and DUF4098 domain-containing protein YvlB